MRSSLPRRLRRDATEAEKALWRILRNRSLGGVKFRRQCPIDRYIADFVCLERRLIIEADGGQHASSEADAVRTAWLESHGFHVARFWNDDILGNPDGVAAVILEALKQTPLTRPLTRPPSPARGEG